MSVHSSAELRRALDIVGSVGDPDRPDPFGQGTLLLLGELLDAETVGYCETSRQDGYGGYEVVTRHRPDWFRAALRGLAREDPTHPVSRGDSIAPVAISDLVRRRVFESTAMYGAIFEPLGMVDSLRIYLPAPSGQARFFFFDRASWGLEEQQRELLGALREQLLRARAEWRTPPSEGRGSLTRREEQILHMVAQGLTNAEIAARLWLSPHTIRTHLQHAYRKLGARTRVQAARAISPRAAPPAGESPAFGPHGP